MLEMAEKILAKQRQIMLRWQKQTLKDKFQKK